MNRSNLSNISSISIKKDLPHYYNHNQAFVTNPKKKQKRSNSLIKFFSPNKTIMDYVEKRLITRKINHLDNISTGSCSLVSYNNKDHHKGEYKTPNSNKVYHMSHCSSFNSYSTLPNGSEKQNKKHLIKVTNESLIEKINYLAKENEELKKENMAYKLLFKELEDKARMNNDNNNIKTLSSHGNLD